MKSLSFLSFLFAIGILIAWKQTTTRKEVEERRVAAPIYCAPSFDPAKMNEGNAPILPGLGNLHYAVSTKSKKAQQFFNQGLTLLYAFNHGEAGRSFKAALKHDSTLAMAYWGLGMVLGPNYNAPLNPVSLEDINAAMDNAIRYSSNASEREKLLVNALSKRFPREPAKDMTPYNAAYAAAMREAHIRFPEDADIMALYGDALMNEHPWNLWLKDGSPQPWTAEIISVLEKGLAKFPKHPGLNHSYMHAVEASADPSKGLRSAALLTNMLPGAGHLVHMPAHIYIRTGHYHKGVQVTEMASVADSTYIAQCKVQGAYPLLYYPHNIHFLAACAFFEGNSKKALEAAWSVSGKTDKSLLAENVSIQHYYIIPFYVMVQLGKWDDILHLPEPGSSMKYPLAIWHYARGMAMAAKGNLPAAEVESKALQAIAADESLKSQLIWDINSSFDLVNIAAHTLAGELAMHKESYEAAIEEYRKAVVIEDKLMYQEPPDWFFSVRHSLGNVLVRSKRFEEAEKVYLEDLKIYKENGWSLMGLYNSLQGQNKNEAAAAVKKRFEEAWKYADFSINSSRKY
jgi:hypothetical protein